MTTEITRRGWLGVLGSAATAAVSDANALGEVMTPAAQLADYDSLRRYTGPSTLAYVSGSPGERNPPQIAGFFRYDPADTASPDDGGTTIVAAGGQRWKRLYSGAINVMWFGAVGDGIRDDTISVKRAIAHAQRSRKTHAGMVAGHSVPEVVFPGGYEFLLAGGISIGADIRLRGDKAILTSGRKPSYPQEGPLFTSVGSGCLFQGLTIFGYKDVISIATNNADASTIDIRDCEFHEFSGHAIFVDNNSPSTLLRIRDNKFYPRLSSAAVLKNWCDRCEFHENWVEGPCDTFIWNKGGLRITGMLGVPTASSPSSSWVRNEGTMLVMTGNRFGGETGARTVVEHHTGPGGTNATQLVMQHNEVWSTGSPVIAFHDIPDVFVFEDNYGLNGGHPFRFLAVPETTRAHLGERHSWKVSGNQHAVLGGQRSSKEDAGTAIKLALLESAGKHLGTATVLASGVVRNFLHTEQRYHPAGSLAPGMATSSGTDLFGGLVQNVHGVDGNSNFNVSWKTGLSGLAGGTYTLLVNFEVGEKCIVQFNMHAASQARQENVGPGRYTLALPFHYDAQGDTSVGYSFVNLRAGGRVSHGGLRIVAGRHDGYSRWNTEAYGRDVPANGYWRVGDRVIQLTPKSGRSRGWICTEAGTPGSWASEGML